MASDKSKRPSAEIESIETQSTRLNDQVSNNSSDQSNAADKAPSSEVFNDFQSDIDAYKEKKRRRTTVSDWSDSDIKRLVKAIRTHRRDTHQIIQEMKKHKPAGHIRRFSKAMCKFLGVSPKHPDLDILPFLKLLRNEPIEPIV